MSTRAIKKLTKKDDLKELEKLKIKSDESDEDEEEEIDLKPKNKFNLLEEEIDDEKDDKQESENENESSEKKETNQQPQQTKKNKNKKKKQKPKSNNKQTESDSLDGFKFVSTNIDEDELLEQAVLANSNSNTTESSITPSQRRALQIESKYLNSENEMIRMFGAKIVQAEKSNQRGNRRLVRQNTIVNKKSTWPEFIRHGLSMKILNEKKESNNTNGLVEFAFEHSKEYQKIQFAFLDSVESLDHNNIINLLHIFPYHIDSLIQLSDICRMSDNTQMATDLIERALYSFQNCFHPSFKFTTSSSAASSSASSSSSSSTSNILNYRLDYKIVENRGLFIALFKHLIYVGGKACYRTSLELCKLLLSLDIDSDPLAVILLIDFYALRSSQYEYFIEFYEAFNTNKHLYLMPNMAMSIGLAYYNVYRQTNNEADLEKADKLLQEALIRFPAVLMELLDKINVLPDKKVESHWIFAKRSHLNVPKGLKYLIDLYVNRMQYEWRIPENLHWLEKNVNQIIAKEKSVESLVNEYKKKCKSLFSKVPPNLYRHLVLADLKEVPPLLPPEYSSNATYSFNPIPPKNSIISYTRPVRQPVQHGTTSRSDALRSFIQSLWPSFNAQEMNQARRQEAENNNEPEEGGAVAGAAGAGQNNRFELQQIISRLREFIDQVEQNFPAAATANRNNDNQPDGENNEDPNLDEFD